MTLRWSGQVDLNHRPHGPEPCALTMLSYAPMSETAPGGAKETRILGEARPAVKPGGGRGDSPESGATGVRSVLHDQTPHSSALRRRSTAARPAADGAVP